MEYLLAIESICSVVFIDVLSAEVMLFYTCISIWYEKYFAIAFVHALCIIHHVE